MKPSAGQRARPPCQILRAPPIKIRTSHPVNVDSIFLTHNESGSCPFSLLPSTGTSVRYSLQPSSLDSSTEFYGDCRRSMEFSGESSRYFGSLRESIGNYSCINSNDWNVVRNSKKSNGQQAEWRRKSIFPCLQLKKGKFTSSKVVKVLSTTVSFCKPDIGKKLTARRINKKQTNNVHIENRLKERADIDLLLDHSVNSKQKNTEKLMGKIKSHLRGKENTNSGNIKIMDEFTC